MSNINNGKVGSALHPNASLKNKYPFNLTAGLGTREGVVNPREEDNTTEQEELPVSNKGAAIDGAPKFTNQKQMAETPKDETNMETNSNRSSDVPLSVCEELLSTPKPTNEAVTDLWNGVLALYAAEDAAKETK